MTPSDKHSVPLATVHRLANYVRFLRRLKDDGREYVSSSFIGERLKLKAIQVRKDLGYVEIVGKPKAGFEVADSIEKIERYLNWDNVTDAFLVGVGHLGTALLGYEGFASHGLNIIAAFDSNEGLVGDRVHGKEVLAMDKLAELVARMHIKVVVLTVPADAAQEVSDLLVEAGILAIWNFTGRKLFVPSDVIVQNQDMSAGLAVLSAKLAEKLR